jgi:magnesium transporter
MISYTTFFLSRIIGRKVYDPNGKLLGIVKDLLIEANYSSDKPKVIGLKLKQGDKCSFYSNEHFKINKFEGKFNLTCTDLNALSDEIVNNNLLLVEVVLDKQIVDLNGRKLVRVNDVRLVQLREGIHIVAVDIGVEGLLRRIGIVRPLKFLFSIFGATIPAKFILWEDVEAVDYSNLNIKLSKSYKKLHTLHPSDIADIIEDLGKTSSTEVFSSLDEEKAADVLEELDPETQVHIVESMPVEKMADVLEKMPADEVADIIDALEDEKAELLLNEMEEDSSQEVRDLLEYPDNRVGSIMTTEVLTFHENNTVEDVINDLRTRNPENDELYNLFVTDNNDRLIATFSLRDLILTLPDVKISQVMKPSLVHLRDYQKVDDVAEIISKYNMLAIPVINDDNILQGMVVIDDVVEDLINKRRTNK